LILTTLPEQLHF